MNLKDTVAGFGDRMLQSEMDNILGKITTCKEVQVKLAEARLALKNLATLAASVEDDLAEGFVTAVQKSRDGLPPRSFGQHGS
jgi:hypothetical protein